MNVELENGIIRLSPSEPVHFDINNVWVPLTEAGTLYERALMMIAQGVGHDMITMSQYQCALKAAGALLPYAVKL